MLFIEAFVHTPSMHGCCKAKGEHKPITSQLNASKLL